MSIIEFFQNPVVGVIGFFGALSFSFLCSLLWEYVKEGKIKGDIWRRTIKVFLIIAVASILLVIVYTGMSTFFSAPMISSSPKSTPQYIRDNTPSTCIEGVSDTLYRDGIAFIKSCNDQSYINELKNIYASNGYLGVAYHASQISDAIDALMPNEPAGNDSLFVEVLQTIQKNISSAALMDILQAESGADANGEQSKSRWNIVNSAIVELESATTANDLNAILNGEKITVTTETTPAPTPEAVTYQTLSWGAKSDAVLALQNRLYELGFLNDDRDGNFGYKTQTAVKLFQSAVGLEVTGIADSMTQERLYADDAPRVGRAAIPQSAIALKPVGEAMVYHSLNGKFYHRHETCMRMSGASPYKLADVVGDYKRCWDCDAPDGTMVGKDCLWMDENDLCHTTDECASFVGDYHFILRNDALEQGLAACSDCGANEYFTSYKNDEGFDSEGFEEGYFDDEGFYKQNNVVG